jgi:hypothetical protein
MRVDMTTVDLKRLENQRFVDQALATTMADDLSDHHTADLLVFETLNLTVNSVGVRMNPVGEGLSRTSSAGLCDENKL